jgi:hypothetical protein
MESKLYCISQEDNGRVWGRFYRQASIAIHSTARRKLFWSAAFDRSALNLKAGLPNVSWYNIKNGIK